MIGFMIGNHLISLFNYQNPKLLTHCFLMQIMEPIIGFSCRGVVFQLLFLN